MVVVAEGGLQLPSVFPTLSHHSTPPHVQHCDGSKDCGISINLEMQLDTGSISQRRGDTVKVNQAAWHAIAPSSLIDLYKAHPPLPASTITPLTPPPPSPLHPNPAAIVSH